MQELTLPAYADSQKTKLPSAQIYVDAFKWLFGAVSRVVHGIVSFIFEQSPVDRHIEEMRHKVRLHNLI